jgi:Protein of unknown function (DUF2612)
VTLVEEAQSLLLQQFAHSPKLTALVRCLMRPFQEVLDILEALHHGGYIKHAENHRLSILGQIVGQNRRDMNDENFRVWIQAGIKLNTCGGTAEENLALWRLLYPKTPALRFQEYQPNQVVFIVFLAPTKSLNTIFGIIKKAVPLTMVCHFICAHPKNTFSFDVTPFATGQLAEYY